VVSFDKEDSYMVQFCSKAKVSQEPVEEKGDMNEVAETMLIVFAMLLFCKI